MYSRGFLSILVLSLALTAQSAFSFSEYEAVPGEFLIKYKDGVNVQGLLAKSNLRVKSMVPHTNIVVVERSMLEQAEFVISSLSMDSRVEVVEPNFIYRPIRLPNDPDLSKLWGLVNTGQLVQNSAGRAGVDVGAEQAWDIQTGKPEVVVAVIDTGIDPKIPDLAPNMWVNEVEQNGQAGVDDDNNGYVDDVHGYDFVNKTGNLIDDYGHGSHCAGTIAARGDDGYGVAGVAWNVRLMGLKFISKSGGGTLEDAIKAINYAVQMKAQLSSNSWGGGGYSKILEDAIRQANEAGMLFVAAAGNDTNDNDAKPTYPATYDIPNILAVAAIDNKGGLAYFSNYGAKTVDVAAPGVDVFSTTPKGFEFMSGTSMAAPHVSGIAALLLSNEPTLTPAQVIERLIATVKPLPNLRGKVLAGGIANAYFALINQPPPPDPNDPNNWCQSMPFTYSTVHPYANNFETSFEVRVESATKIAIHFAKFETEKRFDKVTFWSPQGVLLGEMDGNNNDSFSPSFEGDTVIVKFKTDSSAVKYGFDIDRVAYQ